MDPTLNTSSGGFLGGLGDIALSYLATRANLSLQNQSGGTVPQNYLGSAGNPAPAATPSASGVLRSPLLWIGVGGLLFIAVLLIAGRRK